MERKISRRRILQAAGMLGATAAVFSGSDITKRSVHSTAFAQKARRGQTWTDTTFFHQCREGDYRLI